MVKSILRHWLPLAALSVLVSLMIFVSVQQVLRIGANDPQIQMAEDAAARLSNGSSASSVRPASPVDIGRSLAPFIIVYNDGGAIVDSSATLHGQTPGLPTGVLDYVRTHGQDRITWQPAPGVRIAAVIERFAGADPGFVLAGRSLREVELRESNAQALVLVGLAVTLVGTLVIVVVGDLLLAESRLTKKPVAD
jgi:hypothetical protein